MRTKWTLEEPKENDQILVVSGPIDLMIDYDIESDRAMIIENARAVVKSLNSDVLLPDELTRIASTTSKHPAA